MEYTLQNRAFLCEVHVAEQSIFICCRAEHFYVEYTLQSRAFLCGAHVAEQSIFMWSTRCSVVKDQVVTL